MEHPLDRIARTLRPVFITLAYMTAPVSLIGYGKMLLMAFEAWPWWVSAAVVISQVIVALGLSSRLDARQEERQSRQPDL